MIELISNVRPYIDEMMTNAMTSGMSLEDEE